MILALSVVQAPKPVKQESVPVVAIDLKSWVPRPVVPIKRQVSRSMPRIEHRVMRITAYTARDKGMDGRGITTSGERVQEGRTIAAAENIPFGTEIYIPSLNCTYIVEDRGGAISRGQLDLYMDKRSDALEFGSQELEVIIKH